MKKIFSALKGELLGILHNRKLLIAVIGVMAIPLLYSGTYLWAFWDPYGHLDRLPVAVVNNDRGVVYNGQKLRIGNDLVRELKDKKSFNWKFVSEKEADSGLENQHYYLKIEIPKDFSRNATTLQSSHPKKLNLIYSANDGFNYLSSKIGDSAIEKIKEEVSAAVTKTYAETMYKNIKEMASGLTKAGNGAGELNNGINTAKTGAAELASGIVSANGGTSKLQSGAVKVDSVAKELANNLQTLAAKSAVFTVGLDSAQAGAKQLANGASGLSSLMTQWNQGALRTEQGAQDLSQGLQQTADLVNQMAAAADTPEQKAQLEALQGTLATLYSGSKNVAAGVNGLSSNAGQLKQASDSLSSGANQLNDGLNQLAEGSHQFENGTNQLVQGSKQLADGTARLTAGTGSLNSGMSRLSKGSGALISGINGLSSGSQDLKIQLEKGAKDAGDVKGNNSVYNMFAKPVNLKDKYINYVPNYGTGFAPYFLSLSLFVGAVVLSVIFPMVEPAEEPKSGLSWFAGKLGVLLSIGLVQALLADFILLKVLGLDVKNVPYFMMLSIFTSWTFFAIIQFLVSALDNPGRFLAIIILVLQLTSSAGTYPIELTPGFLQSISHYMPMTYAVAGFRAVVSTGDFHEMWKNIGFEALFFMSFLFAALSVFASKFKRRLWQHLA